MYHPQAEMWDGLISIIHSVSPSTVGEGLLCGDTMQISPLDTKNRGQK